MKNISDQLTVYASAHLYSYLRAASLQEANIKVHYHQFNDIIIIYVGYGSTENTFEGAEPLQEVECSIYVLVKKTALDMNAIDVDTLLQGTQAIAADITYSLTTARDIEDYTLEPVTIFDDKLVGHLLTVSPILEGNVCNS